MLTIVILSQTGLQPGSPFPHDISGQNVPNIDDAGLRAGGDGAGHYSPQSERAGLAVPFPPWLEDIWFPTMLVVMALGFGVAILRHRLFDIDILINRALVYGALTASVTGLYIFVVGYLSALFWVEEHLFISLAAAGLQPDLILMEINLPQINGIEATRRILAQSPDIGVLIITIFQFSAGLL